MNPDQLRAQADALDREREQIAARMASEKQALDAKIQGAEQQIARLQQDIDTYRRTFEREEVGWKASMNRLATDAANKREQADALEEQRKRDERQRALVIGSTLMDDNNQ